MIAVRLAITLIGAPGLTEIREDERGLREVLAGRVGALGDHREQPGAHGSEKPVAGVLDHDASLFRTPSRSTASS